MFSRPRLEQALKAGKSTFEQLLQDPPPSASDADLIRKATTEVDIAQLCDVNIF